ncbi:rhamnulokinase [Paludicola sp. MB14-C6]|uniref:rhamnulokinase n=1 Tax=Paludihabitans sp. MB14-C6 TaxID=3070656 RepID=UPI0027DD0D0D|nr:rhamnulokinase [Paludicola sp. MB14-C6]WMJ23174.1 rhamnulokinase [Paludicola sp. MB14-C6]
MQYYLAVDIGASSGRHVIGYVNNGKINLIEVYRFENKIINKGTHLVWDLDNLFKNILIGMKKCKGIGKVPTTIGIDTWGVDFVLLDDNNKIVGDSVAYRDSRTKSMDKIVNKFISNDMLYKKTGIQKQLFNTIYQLMAMKQNNPELLNKAESFLMIPDYFNFLLTGVKKNEYTNATTTNLVNVSTKEWDIPLIKILDYPEKLFQNKLSAPLDTVGMLLSEIQEIVGYNCTVILPPTHDTGSAYMAVPSTDDDSVYLSSGTWSLLGVENKKPITTNDSINANFTNEGGYNYNYRFLKNIMGLWMIQSIKRDYDNQYSFSQLEGMARKEIHFNSIVDVNDSSFLSPTNMIEAVKAYCQKTNQAVPQTPGEVVHCVYISLALCYANAIQELSNITGKQYTSINIVGGGSRDNYLNELTAAYANLRVYAGPIEATSIGNLLTQFIYANEFENLTEARKAVKNSFLITRFEGEK